MISRKLSLPPEFAYPIDDWRLDQRAILPARLGEDETLFATGNGYLGMRGMFEEGTPVYQPGTFINGLYESWRSRMVRPPTALRLRARRL